MKKYTMSKILKAFTFMSFIFVCALAVIFACQSSNNIKVNAENNTYLVEISEFDSQKGDISVVAMNASGEKIEFVSGQNYEQGSKITITATAAEYYEFSYFTVQGQKFYDRCTTFIVENSDLNIAVVFSDKKYEVNVTVRDSRLSPIGNKPYSVKVNGELYGSINEPTQTFVKIGDDVTFTIQDNSSLENYKFLGWFVQGENHEPFFLESGAIEITKEFIDDYSVDGVIDVYCQYVQLCSLKIFIPEEYKSNVSYILKIREGLEYHTVSQLANKYDYGTEFQISAAADPDYDFLGFGNVTSGEMYIPGMAVLNFVLTGDRTISINCKPKQVDVQFNTDYVSGGKIKTNMNRLAIGDTLILSYEISNLRKIGSFTVNDKTGQEFAQMLNIVSASQKDVATYYESGILSVFVDEDVYAYFKSNPTFTINASSVVNVKNVLIIVFYVCLVLLFGAGMVVFTMLYFKEKNKVQKENLKKAEFIKKNHEIYLKQKSAENIIADLNERDTMMTVGNSKITAADKDKKKTVKRNLATATKKEKKESSQTKKSISSSKSVVSKTKKKQSAKSINKTKTKSEQKTKNSLATKASGKTKTVKNKSISRKVTAKEEK